MVMQAWSVERVRAAEEAAKKFLPDDELMNRAAHGLANVLATRTDEIAQHISPGEDVRMIVLAGPGGNGGDALFAAAFLRHFHTTRLEETDPTQTHVADIVPVLLTDQAHPSALQAIHDAGLTPLDASTDEGLTAAVHMIATADIIVDGLFGIGGRLDLSHHDENTPPPAAWTLVNAIPDDAYLIAVDVASGTDPAGETETDNCVWADETVTFSLVKGTHLLAGENATGLLTIIDIGIDEHGLLGLGTDGELANENEDHIDALLTDGPATPMAERLTFDDVSHMWPTPGPRDDKYSRGVVGIIAGGENYTGAAILTVTAAVNTGAGMVRYIGPQTPTNLIRAHIPEAVHGPGKVQAWVIGPGLDPHPADDDETGHTHLTHARQALDSNEPAVIDAGGLDLLTGPRPHAGARTLITPHAGELARLLTRLEPGTPTTREDVENAPVAHARRAAKLLHATVLLKGNRTLVVPPSDNLPIRSQTNAPAWLATAGAGDVLAGIAGTLLAAGLDPLDAGSLAALVHGVAAHDTNPGGPIRALHVAETLPTTIAALLRRPN